MRACRSALVVAAIGVAAAAGAARAAASPPSLPPAALTVPGRLEALAAAGANAAVATADERSGCAIRVVDLARGTAPTTVAASLPCAESADGPNASIRGLWLGRNSVVATVDDAPSPHGETWTLWEGSLPHGPLRALGVGWSWFEDVPQDVAAGKIHYFLSGGNRGGSSSESSSIAAWVAQHFTAKTVGGVTVYDLTSG